MFPIYFSHASWGCSMRIKDNPCLLSSHSRILGIRHRINQSNDDQNLFRSSQVFPSRACAGRVLGSRSYSPTFTPFGSGWGPSRQNRSPCDYFQISFAAGADRAIPRHFRWDQRRRRWRWWRHRKTDESWIFERWSGWEWCKEHRQKEEETELKTRQYCLLSIPKCLIW